MSVYAELMAQANALIDQAEAARKIEKDAAILEIRNKMEELGLTLADIGGNRFSILSITKSKGPASKKQRAPKDENRAGKSDLPAKFKGPEGQLWSGIGRHPHWYREALANGKKPDDFRI